MVHLLWDLVPPPLPAPKVQRPPILRLEIKTVIQNYRMLIQRLLTRRKNGLLAFTMLYRQYLLCKMQTNTKMDF